MTSQSVVVRVLIVPTHSRLHYYHTFTRCTVHLNASGYRRYLLSTSLLSHQVSTPFSNESIPTPTLPTRQSSLSPPNSPSVNPSTSPLSCPVRHLPAATSTHTLTSSNPPPPLPSQSPARPYLCPTMQPSSSNHTSCTSNHCSHLLTFHHTSYYWPSKQSAYAVVMCTTGSTAA